MSIKVISISPDSKDYGQQLQLLENSTDYPYGSDHFKLDHGCDYFAFFKRLGEVKFNLAIDKGEVVGCGSGVLRTLNFESGNVFKCWYLCDLKVRKDYRGRRVPSQVFAKGLLGNYIACSRGYAVSMNPPSGENKVISLLQRFSWIPFRHSCDLNFYTLSYNQVLTLSDRLLRDFGSDSFLSLQGKKDLIFASDGQRMPLLHYQYGPCAEMGGGAAPGCVHMFCAPVGSKLDISFKEQAFNVAAKASVISHRMPAETNWDFILSSDI